MVFFHSQLSASFVILFGSLLATSAVASPTDKVWVDCAGVLGWARDTAYVAGNKVTYADNLWIANQWNYNEVPGGAAGAWNDEGTCYWA